MKQFKITIPKPCHEDWSKMIPKERGRFCASCAKTVVDFTKKTTEEIQEYLIENRDKRVCGHFYRKQLDSIVLQIPETTFQQQLSFQKLFILALLFIMGTTLFSCKTDTGKIQKIDKVELIDTIVKIEKIVDTTIQENIPPILGGLRMPKENCKNNSISKDEILDGEIVINTVVGDVDEKLVTSNINSRDSLPKVIIMGAIRDTGELEFQPTEPYNINFVDTPPRFKETKVSSKEILQKEFNKKMQEFVAQNFDFSFTNNLNLSKGKKRIMVKFVINKEGNVDDIQVRAPHLFLKKKAVTIFEKLPNFIPAKKSNEYVSTHYIQPITFVVE